MVKLGLNIKQWDRMAQAYGQRPVTECQLTIAEWILQHYDAHAVPVLVSDSNHCAQLVFDCDRQATAFVLKYG